MEEAQEILLNSLRNSGILIPIEVLSVKDLTPALLFSICSQALCLVNGSPLMFPDTLPDSMADRFKICTDMASAIKDLGYIGDVSFHKFLYPSEDDLYKLVRFLIKKLSESSLKGKVVEEKIDAASKLKDSNNERTSKGFESGNEESFPEFEQKFSLEDQSSKVKCKVETLEDQKRSLMEEMAAKSSEIKHLEEEHEFLKTSVEMVFDDQHPVDFYIERLNAQVDAKTPLELQSQWDASKKTLEEKSRSLEESLYVAKPEFQEKYQKLKEVELETQSILSEISKREEEHSKLSADLEKQPKVASRRYYIQRITEITKNSRKQDVDMDRILKETRELQLESNSIQERLHRTYAITSETLLREAKKEPVGRQAYKLLTNIHENFEQISEKILATDRLRREIADYEKKLTAMASRGLDVDKLQADLDAIRKENEYFEQQLQNTCL